MIAAKTVSLITGLEFIFLSHCGDREGKRKQMTKSPERIRAASESRVLHPSRWICPATAAFVGMVLVLHDLCYLSTLLLPALLFQLE
jgi:hypothetical protein